MVFTMTCVTSPTDIFSTVIHHLVLAVLAPPCPILAEMSSSASASNSRYAAYQCSHASLGHRITFDYRLSSLAPAIEGRVSGYFEDSATRALLDLHDEDVIMHSGTYGPKEPGAK